MDENLKKKIASLGMAATMASSISAANNMNAGEKDVVSNIGYVQDVIDENIDNSVELSSNDVPLFNKSSDSVLENYDIDIDSSLGSVNDVIIDNINNNSVQKSFIDFNISNESNSFSASSKSSNENNVSNYSVNNNFTDSSVNSISEDNKLVDYDCYSLMQDAIGYALNRFNSNYDSLSAALESSFNVKLSDSQRDRYDTIMKDTYEVYKKGIEAYDAGDISAFRKICDEVLNSNKYLNLDDLVDILSININLQGDYIKDSSNYSIKDGKLIIDGITVDGLFSSPNYVDYRDLMSLIKMYDGRDKSDTRVLDIMQIPIFVSKLSTNPANFTLVSNNSVYAYDHEELMNRINGIDNYYSSCVGLDRFNIDYVNGERILCAYDKDNNRININDNEYASEIKQYLDYLYQYHRSIGCKVGYFDGAAMKNFLAQYDNNNTDIKVSAVNSDLGLVDYDCYSLMQDSVGFYMDRFVSNYSSLSDILELTYNCQLSDEQRERYNTLLMDTYDAYRRGIDAYQSGRVSEFRKICDEILVEKKYMNLDDLVDILSINVNSQDKVINNSKNYSIIDDKLIIDGVTVESLLSLPNYIDYKNVMSLVSMYSDSDVNDFRVLDIMQVPNYIMMESINPTSFSLMVNGTVYSYNNDVLNEKFADIDNYFSSNLGLNNFGIEKSLDGNALYYGFDNEYNKQYIDNNNEYVSDLSRYITVYKPQYEESKNGRVGYFDGQMMKDYLEGYDNIEMSMSK